ncbi:hypothetical protein O0550_00250 [Brevibacillus halotolerans]|uniref:hypothetical protein n=1 Tax=Brevibacillus TaxID=55080 RepID=UPI00215B7E10|nr:MULTISPECIES: hypothetical protein [Brevibacillus]MCR8961640.1 hypothetical protein [Brevibacillus laterosporus]MCZ0833795.1 hypothetical protein [Brevibacillus halotolerans]
MSGAISYTYSFAWAVKSSVGDIYVFAHKGRLHGTFESGSRDDDWGESQILPALRQGWSDLERGWSYHWSARVNPDFQVFLDQVIKTVAAGEAVAKVVTIFV